MTDRDMRLEAGSVVALRFYDLGRAVDLDALARTAGGDVDRPQFPAVNAGLRYGRAPVELSLDDVEVQLEDGRVFGDTSVRVFDFGVAVVALRVLVGGLDWDRFTERVEEIGTAVSGRAPVWADVEQRVRGRLQKGGLKLEGDVVARHVFVIARRFGDAVPLDELIDDDYAASIVSRDWLPLTGMARADLLRGARAFGSDLIVAGEERSFIVESAAGSGVPDAIEAALAQRALYDVAHTGADGRGNARGIAARVRAADALIAPERGGRLAALYSTARDRFRLAEAESLANRGLATVGGAGVPWVPLVAVAVVTAILTAIVVLALG